MAGTVDLTTHPKNVRARVREGNVFGLLTAGVSGGFLQAGVTILPQELAGDFAEFCRLNSAPCPLLYVSKPGEVEAPPLAEHSDIRTDLARYHVIKNGNLVSDPGNLLDKVWSNLVTFYLGCSYAFEMSLTEAGIPMHHIDLGRQVPMFITNIPCHPVGKFNSPMVVSLRAVSRDKVEKAVQVTTICEAVHGAPIHIGNPEKIGVTNITSQDFGDKVADMKDDEVPVFWACGVTGNLATQAAGPELAFNHSPGCMFVSDVKVDDYIQKHPPESRHLIPRVLFIEEHPAPFATIVSETALNNMESVLRLIKETLHIEDMDLSNSSVFPKAVLILSHLSAVTLVSSHLQFDEGFLGLVSLLQALAVIDKQVTVFLSDAHPKVMTAFQEIFESGILSRDVHVSEVSAGSNDWDSSSPLAFFESRKGPGSICSTSLKVFDSLSIKTRKQTPEKENAAESGYLHCCASSSDSCDVGGFALTAGLHVARTCPLHDRYIRRGIGIPQRKKLVSLSDENGEVLRRVGMSEDTVSKSLRLMTCLTESAHLSDLTRGSK